MAQGIWVTNPDTNEPEFLYYNELDGEILQHFVKPVGGFLFPADLFQVADLAEVPFYVKDWLPKRGKALLYAPAKAGKSTVCLQMARCIGIGEPFLGMPTNKGKVVYMQFELGEAVLQGRMKDKEYDNVWVGTTFVMKLDTVPGKTMFTKAVEAVMPDVIILDPKYKMITGDENEANDMRPICDYLDGIIEAYECSIFIVDHSGKDMSKRGRGSSIWEDWVDSYIQMSPINKKGEPLKVEIKPIFLRHAPLPDDPIIAVLNNEHEFELADQTLTIKGQIADWIRSGEGPVTTGEILAQGYGSPRTVFKRLKELETEGKIRKEERGSYIWC